MSTTTTTRSSFLQILPQETRVGTGKAELTKAQSETYKKIKEQSNLSLHWAHCETWLAGQGINVTDVSNALAWQRPFDGRRSTITALKAGLAKPGYLIAFDPVYRLFAYVSNSAMTGIRSEATRYDVYLNWDEGFGSRTLIHEALHSATRLDDIDLAFKLTGKVFDRDHPEVASQAIDNVLLKNGCN